MPGKRVASNGMETGPAAKLNKSLTDWKNITFDCKAKTGDEKEWNLKICSWNVDGLRACCKKGGADILKHEDPDIMCFQETKVSEKKLPDEMKGLEDYPHQYWLAAKQDGYSSVGLLTKEKPVSVEYGLGEGADQHNDEGRIITAEFDTFYLVTAYVPNAGRKLVTLDKRLDWDPRFLEHLVRLDKKKPVVICGDLNVAHKEIDLRNPKTNSKNAGFTKEEREGFTKLLEAGFVDTYRHFNPTKTDAYSFWTYMMNCRAKNVGWRLDYFLVSERLVPKLADSVMRDQVFGSDHCPITIMLEKPN